MAARGVRAPRSRRSSPSTRYARSRCRRSTRECKSGGSRAERSTSRTISCDRRSSRQCAGASWLTTRPRTSTFRAGSGARCALLGRKRCAGSGPRRGRSLGCALRFSARYQDAPRRDACASLGRFGTSRRRRDGSPRARADAREGLLVRGAEDLQEPSDGPPPPLCDARSRSAPPEHATRKLLSKAPQSGPR